MVEIKTLTNKTQFSVEVSVSKTHTLFLYSVPMVVQALLLMEAEMFYCLCLKQRRNTMSQQ